MNLACQNHRLAPSCTAVSIFLQLLYLKPIVHICSPDLCVLPHIPGLAWFSPDTDHYIPALTWSLHTWTGVVFSDSSTRSIDEVVKHFVLVAEDVVVDVEHFR